MHEQLTTLLSQSTQPQIGKLLFALAASIVFAYALSQLYKAYYGRNEPTDYSIGASFLIMMPATTAIFIVIQYSLPLSLGLLGALSFVRFRNPVKRAEDIAFILLGISISLSCAVQYYHIALFLLALVLIYVVVRARFNLSGIFSVANTLVTVKSSRSVDFSRISKALPKEFGVPNAISWQSTESGFSCVFSIKGHDAGRHHALIDALRAELGNEAMIDVFYPGNEIVA
jgi:hypothetical protein